MQSLLAACVMRIASGGCRTERLAPQVRVGLAGVLAVAMNVSQTGPLRAEPASPPGWREVWAGADVSTKFWLLYSGVTVAPMGHIHSEGIRMRAAGGYGEYRYTDEVDPTAKPALSMPKRTSPMCSSAIRRASAS